jgi:parvulin-like peptidyl-prolyl isomerase
MTFQSKVLSILALLSFTFASTAMAKEPDRITVQHILIAFQKTLPGKQIERTQAQAEALATKVLQDAKKKGADFGALVKSTPTDDQAPGIYKMANKGVTPSGPDEYPRQGMVAAFGDVGFKLKVGEVGLAKYDPKNSPFGYHIIKRIK